MAGRRPVSPFGRSARYRGGARLAALAVCAALAGTIVMTVHRAERARHASAGRSQAAAQPAATTTLAAAPAPGQRLVLLVLATGVQYSCFGRLLPGDVQATSQTPAVIDRNPLTVWDCDGDGARLRPRQSLAVFFGRTVTLTELGVIGYDPLRPCRFVTRMELMIGGTGYRIRLPATRYPALRWFAVPPSRTDRLTLVVTQTSVPAGRPGPSCARTAIAQVGFAGGA